MKKLLIMLLFTATMLLNACGGGEAAKTSATPPPARVNKVAIFGSTTLLPVAQRAVEAFKQRKPEITISLTGGDSQTGINGLTDGYADIATSSRELKSEETQKLGKRHIKPKETIVAYDGIIPIVHPSNPVKNLTMAQLKEIYTGKITDWQQVGGKKGSIVVVSRYTTSGTDEVWTELVLNGGSVVASSQETSNSEAMLEMIASTPNAIGYDGIGYVEGNKQVKAVSVDGQAASDTSILNKSYKIARPLLMFTIDKPNAAVIEFLNFMTSPEGQALVKAAKFVPIQ